MGGGASLPFSGSGPSSGPLISHSITICPGGLGEGGSGAQATTIPDSNLVVVIGGGAFMSVSCGLSLKKDTNFSSMRLPSSNPGPMPSIEGHALVGLSGRKAVVLGGLMSGRRSSGFQGGFSNTIPAKLTTVR